MILEVQTNTGKVDDGLDTSLTELGGVTCVPGQPSPRWIHINLREEIHTNTRSLEDQWGRQSSAGDDNLLAGPKGPSLELSWVKRLHRADYRTYQQSIAPLRQFCWAGTYTVLTPTARPFSIMTLSTLVLQAR